MTTNAPTLPLVGYHVVRDLRALPPLNPQPLCEYLLAGNGLFIRAARPEFLACIPVAPCAVRGLPPLEPGVRLRPPRVPGWLMIELLARARAEPANPFYYLTWDVNAWQWRIAWPAHDDLNTGEEADAYGYNRPVIQIQAQHTAGWATDAEREPACGPLRLTARLGNLTGNPINRLCAVVFGHRWDLPAATAFELPVAVAGN